MLSFCYHKRLSGLSPGNRFSILFVILFRFFIYFQATEKPVEPKFYGYLTFGHMYLHDTLIPFYFLFFMVFSPKYSEKRLICTIYFYLPDFLAPFWHRTPWSKKFSSTTNRCYSTNFILCLQFLTVIIEIWVLPQL